MNWLPQNVKNNVETNKAEQKPKVRFDYKKTSDDEDSEDDELITDDRDPEQKSSTCGISGRIHKRKMPVRRPTGYVPNRSVNKSKEEVSDEKETNESISNNQSNLEKRLEQLSMKYKHHDRHDSTLAENSRKEQNT
ncbi:hypothetical protein DICVIV_05196 [Dictyocaulus viviparus]|uniref:Uncharacterized protein n=1 Tax=Dictyocaulus viviparus TaxID=29172 RepID=A0A0D8XW33_DICVI|nr:hypothetical protein DICVIV_05196 [Dictyocaulus viviparus]